MPATSVVISPRTPVTPSELTQYTNPSACSAMARMRSCEVGATMEMSTTPASRQGPANSSRSSKGTSGRMSASTPASAMRRAKAPIPWEYTTFAYVMNANGTSVFLRRRSTSSNTASVVAPEARARVSASWMTGPSAMGSEKGMPSSMRSAPACAMASTSCSVVSKSGSPQVTKGTNALPPSNAPRMRASAVPCCRRSLPAVPREPSPVALRESPLATPFGAPCTSSPHRLCTPCEHKPASLTHLSLLIDDLPAIAGDRRAVLVAPA